MNRVKAVQTLSIALPSHKSTTIACTVSSDGKIHVYDLGDLKKDSEEFQELQPVAIYDSKGTRLTCVTVADGDVMENATIGKRKRKDGEESDEEEEEGWQGLQVADEEEEENGNEEDSDGSD